MSKTKIPNVVRGGVAIPLGRNLYYMKGRKHSQGGIDIGKNPRTGLEVEDGEIIQMKPKELRVLSAQKGIGTGNTSPAQAVLNGANPDKVFQAQENFKDRYGINDDGTKAELGIKETLRKLFPNVAKAYDYITKDNDKETNMSEPKTTNKKTGQLPYGYTLRNLYKFENPDRKGIKRNIAYPYDGRTIGPGIDFKSGHPELAKKAKKGIPLQDVNDSAVIHLRKDDDKIMSDYANIYGQASADTVSHGPRFLAAQARYQQGNIKKVFPEIARAMYKGDAEALKKAVLKVTPKDHKYRRQLVQDYEVYPSKKQSGGMIQINGNVKNGLIYRSKYKDGGSSDSDNKKEYVFARPYVTRNSRLLNGHGAYDRMSGIGRGIYLLQRNKKGKDKTSNRSLEYNPEIESVINNKGGERKPKDIEGVQKHYNITGSNLNAIGRAINRKTGYIFSKEGKKDYIDVNMNDVLFTNRPDTVPNITAIWANDFSQGNGKPSANKAKEFKNPNYVIDNKIPINKISRYYGNSNGKFKVGSLNEFNDDDYIAAIRNKSMLFDKVDMNGDNLVFSYQGNPVENTITEGKHFIYNPKTGNYRFISNINDIKKLYESYNKFLSENGTADLALLDDGRFEDYIYKGGRRLNDEEVSDYFRNDFNRGFDKVPVIVKTKKFGGRSKAEGGLTTTTKDGKTVNVDFSLMYPEMAEFMEYGLDAVPGKSISYFSPSAFGESKDKVVNINASTGKVTERPISNADPLRPYKSTFNLYDEGYFDNYSEILNHNKRRIKIKGKPIKESNNTVSTISSNKSNGKPTNKSNSLKYLDPLKTPAIKPFDIKSPKIDLSPISEKIVPKLKGTIRDKFNEGPTLGDWIGAGVNLGAGLGDFFGTNAYLNKFKSPDLRLQPHLKLKTYYNNNAEIDEINRNVENISRDIDANTASSSTALARKINARNNATMAKNKSWQNKFNIQDERINTERKLNSNIDGLNADRFNRWSIQDAAINNAKYQAKANNLGNLMGNISGTVNDVIARIEARRNFNNNLGYIQGANPNVDDRIYEDNGVQFDPRRRRYINTQKGITFMARCGKRIKLK